MPPSAKRTRFNVPPMVLQTRRARITKSNGRGDVCQHQGNIVSTVRFTRPEDVYASRKDIAREAEQLEQNDLYNSGLVNPYPRLYAPIGTDKAFTVYKGDLVYSLIKENHQLNVRVSSELDAGEEVFSHVGGLPTTQDIRFAGHVDFSPHEPGNDDVGTIARAGTRTVVNTGPNNINIGDTVYFSPFPYVAHEPATGVKLPAIQEVGQPADKYRPALYGVVGHDVYACISNLQEKVKADIEVLFNGNSSYEVNYTTIHGAIESTWLVQGAGDIPARAYAQIYALWWIALNKLDDVTNGQKIGEFIKDKLKAVWFDRQGTKQKEFLRAIGKGEDVFYHPINSFTYAAKAGDSAKLIDYIHQALRQAESAQQEYFRSKMIGKLVIVLEFLFHIHLNALLTLINHVYSTGKCTRGAAPGQPLDIDIGYFF